PRRERIFRGALLYIIMQKIGEKKGAAFSAICFGIYHWFSYGLFGNFIPMILIFVPTRITYL
ncbi:CPBP family glutamic-type intramembrane protease, partial [Bacillus sp. B-TM1]